MATDPLQYPSSLAQHTLLVVTANEERRSFLAAQLDADGHTVYEADSAVSRPGFLGGPIR
jgi:hypothetical protein